MSPDCLVDGEKEQATRFLERKKGKDVAETTLEAKRRAARRRAAIVRSSRAP